MNDGELLMQHLRTLRSAAQSVVQIIDLIDEQAKRIEASTQQQELVACVHPMAARARMATMGHPDRFFCRACHTQVED